MFLFNQQKKKKIIILIKKNLKDIKKCQWTALMCIKNYFVSCVYNLKFY